MADEIFRLRFVEEIIKAGTVKTKRARLRMRFLTALTLIFTVGASIGAFELIINALNNPSKRHAAHYFSIFIVSGFAVTFFLTFIIFLIAHFRNATIRSCLGGLSVRIDRHNASPGEEITVNADFLLKKRRLNEVKLVFACEKESLMKVINMPSVKKETPYKKELILARDIAPQKERHRFQSNLAVPADALISQKALSEDKPKVMWRITVYFDFLNWHSYEENIEFEVK